MTVHYLEDAIDRLGGGADVATVVKEYEPAPGQSGHSATAWPVKPVANLLLADTLAESIRQLHADIVSRERSTVADIVEIGRLLLEARPAVRGQWETWLAHEFEWSDRTARRYILAAKLSRAVDVADLKISVSVLHVMAELRHGTGKCPTDLQKDRDALSEIIKVARVERVTKHRAETIISLIRHPEPVKKAPADSDAAPRFYPSPERRLWGLERRVNRTVTKDIHKPEGLAAFEAAAERLPPETLLKLIERLQAIYDRRNMGRFAPDSIADIL